MVTTTPPKRNEGINYMCLNLNEYMSFPPTLICKSQSDRTDIVRCHFKGIAYKVGLDLNAYKQYFPKGEIVDWKTIDEKTVTIELIYEYKKEQHKCLTNTKVHNKNHENKNF